MAVTFQAVGTAVSATTGTLTVAWPAHVANDIALLWVTSSGGGTTETLATANGFTLINTQVTGTGTAGTKLSVYWARATSSAMASPVVTAGTDFKYGVITTYRGAMTGVSPINAFAGSVKATASTAATLPAVTTTVANALVVLGIASDVDAATAFLTSTTNANLTGLTERFDAGTVSGLGGGIAVVDGTKATAATTGTTAAVVVSSINAMITVALTPALVATGTVNSTGTLSGAAVAYSLPVSDTFTGTNGAAWDAAKWTQIDGAAPQIQSNRGQTTTGSATMLVSGMPTVTDVDAAITFRFVGAAGSSFRGFTFSVGGNTTYTGYTTDLYWDASTADMWMGFFSEAPGVSWETTAPGFAVDTDYTIRVRRYAGTVYFKWWASAGAEPSSWTYSAPEVTPASSGKIAVYLGADGATFPVAVDNLSAVVAVAEIATATGTINATGTLSGSAFKVAIATGTANASGALSGVATTVVARTGTVGASSTFTATATTVYAPTGTTNAGSTLTGVATTVVTRTGPIQATGTLTATAFKVLLATGTINSTGTLTATQTATLTTTGTINATATLSGTAVAVFVGERTGTAQATASLTAATSIIATLTGTIPATATLTGAATSVRESTGTAQATSSVTGTAYVQLTATGTANATSTVSGSAFTIGLTSGTVNATGQLAGTTTLVAVTTATLPVTATLTATTQAIATLTGTIGALATLTGNATFELLVRNITATGILLARRWDAELTPRDKTGALIERDNTGTLLERTNTGTLTERRWEGHTTK